MPLTVCMLIPDKAPAGRHPLALNFTRKTTMKTLRFRSLLPAVLLLAIAAFAPVNSHAQAFSDYVENKAVDFIFRAQTWTAPPTLHFFLSTSACSDSSFGTEVTGGSYQRAAVAASLANFAGTQSAGSTTASSGAGGQTSNNNAINFVTPTAGWGTVTHWGIADASSGGNVYICAALTQSKTINTGDSVSFAAGAAVVTVQ